VAELSLVVLALTAAAVTAVPTTTTYVVVVVTDIITTPDVCTAFTTAVDTCTINEQALVIGVATGALFATTMFFEVHITRSAAVATIPVTSTVVIAFVAYFVALPTERLASCTAYSLWIKTKTISAISVVVVRPATVATIPIANAIVVVVIACAIALPWVMEAFSRRIAELLESGTPFIPHYAVEFAAQAATTVTTVRLF